MDRQRVAKLIVCVFQDNKVCLWSVGENGGCAMEDELEGDPQLLCEHDHGGDVLDLQVGLELAQGRYLIGP